MPPAIRSLVRDQLPVLSLDGTSSRLAVALQGAQVLDWQPHGAPPVLFLSPRSPFVAGKAVRGGVPLCFPWFGPNPDDPRAPQHGFARTMEWTAEVLEIAADGAARAVFGLAPGTTSRSLWPREFTARLTVRAHARLELALEVRNRGSSPFTFGAALHTYFAVSDVRRISVHGLEDTEYIDKTAGGARRREGTDPIVFRGEVDRAYVGTAAACRIDDPDAGRRIRVAKSGSRSTVVWNPGEAKGAAVADLGPDAWARFVCVETCNAADDVVTLAPGGTHTLAAEISIESC